MSKNLKIALDTYYYEDIAKTVGVIFNDWSDKKPLDIISSWTTQFDPYIPGEFWKRELPCIVNLLDLLNLDDFSIFIVDGFVDVLDEKLGITKPGLGRKLEEKYPDKEVIGVAKSKFGKTEKISAKIQRGPRGSRYLYVQACKMNNKEAGKIIYTMYGEYKLPEMLRILDKETKKEREL